MSQDEPKIGLKKILQEKKYLKAAFSFLHSSVKQRDVADGKVKTVTLYL